MKKVLKNPIFTFIIGAILFSGITLVVATTVSSHDVTYKNTTVEDAIDDLYTKAKPEYNGTTTITPTTSEQVLSTNDKILRSDITIGAIPSIYQETIDSQAATISSLQSTIDSLNAQAEEKMVLNTFGTLKTNTTMTTLKNTAQSSSKSLEKGKYLVVASVMLSNEGSAIVSEINDIDLNITCESCTMTKLFGKQYRKTGSTKNTYYLNTQIAMYYVNVTANSEIISLSYTGGSTNTTIPLVLALNAIPIN